MDIEKVLSELTLEEKAGLCSGGDFWHTKGVKRLGIPPLMLTDGPHGLRKQIGSADNLGIGCSVPSTCFPAACCTANSWDPGLLRGMGEALGEEARSERVSALLGPGLNIKRSPLCGRNFEYFSEDPCLAGKLAAGLVEGIQSRGVGACLKHFAANSQEKGRLISDSVIDERALREIYLAGFETAVRESRPWTVMCSYNQVNGVYASENRKLLTQILREEWGSDGLVVTDWGAANDRVAGLAAGEDLEMPYSGGDNDAKIVAAVRSGKLTEEQLDRAVRRVLELIERSLPALRDRRGYSPHEHHKLARRIAAESMVLLRNGGALPLKRDRSLALIGAFARKPRYQGAGSSMIAPILLDTVYDMLQAEKIEFTYAEGYRLDSAAPDEKLTEEAVRAALNAEQTVVLAGLPDGYESEGFDRAGLGLPECQNRLIERLAEVCGSRLTVVLQGGSPMAFGWGGKVNAILCAYLSGQAGGGAAVDVLYGKVNPSGKLAETWPERAEDTPCFPYYCKGSPREAQYRESLFVGYRYYDKAGVRTMYPFGHGLSYTSFEYSDLRVIPAEPADGGTVRASVRVRNTGDRAGAETVQLYVRAAGSALIRPDKELRDFKKVFLEPGGETDVTFELGKRAFSYYSVKLGDWNIEEGTYEILVGASSADIRLRGSVGVKSDHPGTAEADLRESAPAYYSVGGGVWREGIPKEQFEALYGGALPERRGDRFDINSSLGEIKDTPAGGQLLAQIASAGQQMAGGMADDPGLRKMMEAMLMDMPLRSLAMMSGGRMSLSMVEGIAAALNAGAEGGGKK